MTGDAKVSGAAAGDGFWRFSLALYARPGVAPALLALQDRAGRDVNLILYALWLGAAHARPLDGATLSAAEAAVAPLQGIVAELRGLRRRLRTAQDPLVQALRRRIAALELAGEHSAQDGLAATNAAAPPAVVRTSDRLALAATNLDLYLDGEAGSPEAAVLRVALAGLMRRSED
ncbi:MAG TPA: TIGR02444 family protein [Stellaceae bacterium]|nr:TIGR02444 family protein [Stellaceae bacterium]